MGIRQQNSEPIERGGFFGCRLLVSGSNDINCSPYCIWTSNSFEEEWELDIEGIDNLIDMLKELRKVDESDCT